MAKQHFEVQEGYRVGYCPLLPSATDGSRAVIISLNLFWGAVLKQRLANWGPTEHWSLRLTKILAATITYGSYAHC